MGGDMVSLDKGRDSAVLPPAGETEVMLSLATNVVVPEVGV